MSEPPVTGYVPGTWVAMTGPRAWLLADVTPDGLVTGRCWPLVRRGAGLADVVEALLLDGLRSVDGFALAYHADGQWQLIVRGTATAAVTTDTVDEVTADGVATWVERRFSGAAEVRLSSRGGAGTGPRLPLVAGVVLADEMTVRAREPNSMPTSDPPAPELAPSDDAPAPLPRVSTPAPDPTSGRTESLAHLRAGFAAADPRTFDHLFGATQRPPEPARPTALPPAPQPQRGGLIVSVPWAEPAHGIAKTVNRSALPNALPAGPNVPAVVCAQRHLNPPHTAACRVCGGAIEVQEPVLAPRPALGVLRLSTGDLITLDRGVLMGRAPTPADSADSTRPHVVRLASPSGDISRNHVHVGLADWTVLVTDLASTNGTVVTAPDRPPKRLPANEPQAIEPGTVVSLADEITFRYEVT